MKTTLTFLAFGSFLLSLPAQPIEYSLLVVSRSDDPVDWNLVILECRDAASTVLQRDADFFLNGSRFELPGATEIPEGVLYLIRPLYEGSYRCGSETFGSVTQSPPIQLVARPNNGEDPVIRTSFASTGSTARLDCSITPGALVSQYYVTWRNASNNTIEFFKIPPLRLRADNAAPIRLSDRYSLDYNNFSLFIDDVTPSDSETPYQCVLGVEELRSDYVYHQTENANLRLSIFKPPTFITGPDSEVVTLQTASNVTFKCSVLSSPRHPYITWRHNERVAEDGDKYDISTRSMPNNNREVGGMVSNSVLTVKNLEGFDSGIVECVARYISEQMEVIATETAQASLAVLSTLRDLNPIALRNGGFVFEVSLLRPLLVPIALQIKYTDAQNEALTTTREPSIFYYNTSTINHIAFRDRVPYDSFKVEVRVVHDGTVGPPYIDNNVYNRAGLSGLESGFWVLLCLLVVFSLFAIIALIILFAHFKNTKSSLQAVIGKFVKIDKMINKQQYCSVNYNCCNDSRPKANRIRADDGGQDENTFTEETAKEYAKAVESAITYGRRNSKIKLELDNVLRECLKDDEDETSTALTNQNVPNGTKRASRIGI